MVPPARVVSATSAIRRKRKRFEFVIRMSILFAPLRLDPEVPFLSLFHGHDERVPVAALRFGLPVLHEVVARYVLHA